LKLAIPTKARIRIYKVAKRKTMTDLYNTIENATDNNISTFNKDIIDVIQTKIADKIQQEKENIAGVIFSNNSKNYIGEKISKSTAPEEIIQDFVHSNDPKFKGITKKERIKLALGAYYSMHPEKSDK
jgi:predicted secreted protein